MNMAGRKPLNNLDVSKMKIHLDPQRPARCECKTMFQYVYVHVKQKLYAVGYYCVQCGSLHKLKEWEDKLAE